MKTLARVSVALIVVLSLQSQDRTFSCPAYGGGYLPIYWSPTYAAYIPFDHVTGPTNCTSVYGTYAKIYKGDGKPDIGDGWPLASARVFEDFFFTGSSSGPYGGAAYQSRLVTDVGPTRNYGYGSPANGSTLSAADEDNVANDCYLFNASAYASKSTFLGDLSVSGATSENGSAHFDGTASNPLESSLAKISWDMRVNMDGSNPNNAQVTTVSYNHTCFPAHVIKVQGYDVYSYIPSRSDVTYVTGCLLLQQGKIIGQATVNKRVPCM